MQDAKIFKNTENCNIKEPKTILSMKNICKSFGGTKALSDVSFTIKEGTILALPGENGARKSTLIKILAGVYPKDSGQIIYKDTIIENSKNLGGNNKHAISFIHKDLGLIDWMTVAENVGFSTGFPKKQKICIDWKAMNEYVQNVLNTLGVNIDSTQCIMNLTRVKQSLVAISRGNCQKISKKVIQAHVC